MTLLSLLDPPPDEPDEDGRLAVPDGFPTAPARAAYHGLVGQIIDQVAPHTEADPSPSSPSCSSRSAPRSAAAPTSRSRPPAITRTSF
jgi:hypothetical protein